LEFDSVAAVKAGCPLYVRLAWRIVIIMGTTSKRTNQLPVEVLAIIRLGSAKQKIQYLMEPGIQDVSRLAFKDDADAGVRGAAVRDAQSDATRLAFKDDTDSWVRRAAVRGAKSDATRLAFKDDVDFWVRGTAVSGAKSDATRLAFIDDAHDGVRAEAVRGMQSIAALQLALERVKDPYTKAAIQVRMNVVGETEAPQKSVA
jgi:hypothetical protein